MAISSILGIGGVLPSFAKMANGDLGGQILDLTFRDSCLWMQNSSLLASWISLNLPLPVVGFQFQTPDNLELLKYEYTSYPALNKSFVANTFQKKITTLTIIGLRPITRMNPVGLNYLLNQQGISNYIEKYADRGGLWTLNTMWGIITNLVLTELKGIKINETSLGGVGFEFTFEKLQFSNLNSSLSKVSNLAKALF